MIFFAACARSFAAEPSVPSPPTDEVITSAAQLQAVNRVGRLGRVAVRLEGIVMAADYERGGVVLRDESGFARIDACYLNAAARPGRPIRVAGACTIGTGRWPAFQGVVVDNGGEHSLREAAGSSWLTAGRHSLRVAYHQNTGDRGLQLLYEAPGLTKQPIPDQAFTHAVSAEEVEPVSRGLRYRCFEAPVERFDFSGLTPIQSGVVSNFDVTVSPVPEHYGLEFTGFIEVPADGLYTFTIASDDGSRLFIDEEKTRIELGPEPAAGASAAGDERLPTAAALAARPIRQVRELQELMEMRCNASCQIRFEGAVIYTNRDTLVFQDASGAVRLESPPEAVRKAVGKLIRLEAPVQVSGSRAYLGFQTVVDNDDLHQATEVAGAISLRAGRHAFWVDYFQEARARQLELLYEGPGILRQPIPPEKLFRTPAGDTLAGGGLLPGVSFAAFEGNWRALPDFSALTPRQHGWLPAVTAEMPEFTNAYALRLSGFIELPQDGRYVFSTVSDDGSRLCVQGDDTAVLVLGEPPTLPARVISPGQVLGESEYGQWVEAEGEVLAASDDPASLRLELGSDRGRVGVRVEAGSLDPFLPLVGGRVRLQGICRRVFSEAGSWGGALVVPHADLIRQTGLSPILWQVTPVKSIARLLAEYDDCPGGTLVHFKGALRSEDGQWILADDTGRLIVRARPGAPLVEAKVEAMGRIVRQEGAAFLEPAFWRVLAGEETAESRPALSVLTTLEPVRRMTAAEAARKQPVKARGVLISAGAVPVIQDQTRGIYVGNFEASLADGATQVQGGYYEVEGVTDPGGFAPIVVAQRVRYLGPGQMPEPRRPSWPQLMTGSENVLWVELQGVVRQTVTNMLMVAMRDGVVNVQVANASPWWLASLEGAVIRVQGCPLPVHNGQRQLLSVFLHVPAPEFVSVEVPVPAYPFDGPRVPVAELMRYNPAATYLAQRVKVAGQVTYQAGLTCFLAEATNGLKLVLDNPTELRPGDLVQVVGFPEYGVASPVLQHAIVRSSGNAPLPEPPACDLTNLLSGVHDSGRVRVQGRLVSERIEADGRILLELEMSARLIPVRLPATEELFIPLPPGSLVEVTGICHGLARAVEPGASGEVQVLPRLNAFELLLNSAADLRVLARPPWWTLGRAFAAAGGLALVLLASVLWIVSLRQRVGVRTQALTAEVGSHRRTVEQLNREIEERKRAQYEVEQAQQALVAASRQAGMAEVATSVLHNVGNVLNSVNVSSTVILDRLRELQLAGLDSLAELLAQQGNDLGRFLAEDPRGRQIPDFLRKLSAHLNTERAELQEELQQLRKSVEHINEIVTAQQSFARRSGLVERLEPAELVAEALRLQESSNAKSRIRVEQEAEPVPAVWADRHKAIQILVNLLSNARQAYEGVERADRWVRVEIRRAGEDQVRIEVTDGGVGIPAENLTRIFSHGFTTRKDGHGFGLHSGALSAREMGGSLSVHSGGLGRGAAFSLLLPTRN